jgi:hypothetical protein
MTDEEHRTRRILSGREPRTFFIAEPCADPEPWGEWEVGECGSRRRVCLTASKELAQEIADALTSHYAPKSLY